MSKERNIGQDVRNVGLVIAALGIISYLADLALPVNRLIVGSAVLAGAGEIYNRTRS